MTPSYILWVVGKEVWLAGQHTTILASKNQQTIVVSRIVEVGGPFLFNLLYWYKLTWA